MTTAACCPHSRPPGWPQTEASPGCPSLPWPVPFGRAPRAAALRAPGTEGCPRAPPLGRHLPEPVLCPCAGLRPASGMGLLWSCKARGVPHPPTSPTWRGSRSTELSPVLQPHGAAGRPSGELPPAVTPTCPFVPSLLQSLHCRRSECRGSATPASLFNVFIGKAERLSVTGPLQGGGHCHARERSRV